MKLSEKMKIKLWLTRYTYEDLVLLKYYVDDEFKKRKKVIKKIRDN